ncbi:uncharacterized protein LOC132737559 [Ruditapes philippinarum]|uniref:uncharacterized protein LOC132737559 n=1 Tax=Ruditapes philippinarum TaxID=129788 RepID=UPI00295B9FB9|nr:uncharacterized protein LOC132737559 [Ruditapes philippinarum]
MHRYSHTDSQSTIYLPDEALLVQYGVDNDFYDLYVDDNNDFDHGFNNEDIGGDDNFDDDDGGDDDSNNGDERGDYEFDDDTRDSVLINDEDDFDVYYKFDNNFDGGVENYDFDDDGEKVRTRV